MSAPERWEWWSGDNDEVYQLGPFGDREEALQAALDSYDGHTVYLVEATHQNWPAPAAANIIDDMVNNADDLFSEDIPDLTGTAEQQKEAEQELQVALDAWMEKWRSVVFPQPTMFGKTRNAEIVIPSEERANT